MIRHASMGCIETCVAKKRFQSTVCLVHKIETHVTFAHDPAREATDLFECRPAGKFVVQMYGVSYARIASGHIKPGGLDERPTLITKRMEIHLKVPSVATSPSIEHTSTCYHMYPRSGVCVFCLFWDNAISLGLPT